MRDSFIFYRSFFESFDGLSKKDKLILFEAVCNYALNDIEPELSGVPSAMFKLLKPQLDANIRRFENGCKGGRPKKTEAKPKQNQTETKTKPNYNHNLNLNLNHNHNDNDNHNYNAPGSVGGGGNGFEDEFNIWKMLGGEGIDKIYDAYPNTGGLLLDEVYADIKAKQKKVKSPVAYVLGYAKKVGWNDQRM
jgi:hypothetical protein